MKKALVLVLVTLVQSQSDGVVLPDTEGETLLPRNAGVAEGSVKDWENFDWTDGAKDEKRSLGDSFTRRSALDKNFMRFGRGSDGEKGCGRRNADGRSNFYRFGRGLKDNFIRFGRSRENFVRFGRGGGKDGFIRFGRTRPEDFFRAGKSLRENFIRFGKADKNFMRFGRKEEEEGEEEEEEQQRSRKSSNFLRFGKNGKNGTNFLRFGKSEEDEVEREPEEGRRKRDTRNKRGTGYFEIPFLDFPRRITENSWGGLDTHNNNNNNNRLTPFFPVLPNFSKNPQSLDFAQSKRNQGGSNFIRFG